MLGFVRTGVFQFESCMRMPVTSSMRVLLPVLLATLLGVEQAHSLVCFSCTNQQSNWYCLKPTVCAEGENYCVTLSASAGIGNIDLGYSLNKGCSSVCPGSGVNLGVASVGTHCCGSFLCNFSTAGRGLRASTPLLGLGLLLSLLTLLRLSL